MHTLTIRRAARIAAIALFVFVVAGCGGGGNNSAPPPPPAGNVGPAGATVTSPDNNASLDVPAGALSSTINVTLTPASDGFQPDPQVVPGTIYKLDTPATSLAIPAELTIGVPASAFATSDSTRKHVLANIDPKGFLGCYLRSFTIGQGYSFLLLGNQPGTDLPPAVDPSATNQIVCAYDNDLWIGSGCPPSFVLDESGIWFLPSYFTPQNPSTFPPGSDSGEGRVNVCAVAPVPLPWLVSLSPGARAALLPTKWDGLAKKLSTNFLTLTPGLLGALLDKTAPVVHLTSVVTPVGTDQATITLTADATDNVGVTQVTLKQSLLGLNPINGNVTVSSTPLAQFVAPPYTWQSPPMPLAQVYNFFYVAKAFDAAGNVGTASNLVQQGAPVISAFTATPSAVPFGGGSVTLSWSASNANTLTIDNGIGDVSGVSSKTVTVTSPTMFKLTAANTNGTVMQTVTVDVMAQPAPVITSFTATPATLPAGGGAVTLAWTTTNANTLSIAGLGNVTGSSTVVNVTATSNFTLTAANTNQSTMKSTGVIVATAGDRFVDVTNGSDANSCAQAAPCKTIAKAMTGAPSGSQVYLADGTYGSATQAGGATIPDGVTLRAANAGAAIVSNVPLVAAGSAIINGIVLDQENNACASVTASAASGTPTLTLSGVLIKCMGAVNIGGNVNATMTPGALPGGVYTAALPGNFGAILSVSGTGQLLIQGGVIDGNNAGAAAFGAGLMAMSGQGKLTLSGVSVVHRKGTVIAANGDLLGGPAGPTVVLNNGTVLDDVGAADVCGDGAAIIINGTAHLSLVGAQISNVPNVGICVRTSASVPTISLTQTTIAHTTSAIQSEGSTGAVVTLDGASLTNNSNGIQWDGIAGTSFDVKNSIVTGNNIGIRLNFAAGSFKLRSSNVSNNTNAGVALFGTMNADLGTSASLGGNTFIGNTFDGLTDNLVAGSALQAVGNTWIANQQGADANGHYAPAAPQQGPASGKNFEIGNASTLSL